MENALADLYSESLACCASQAGMSTRVLVSVIGWTRTKGSSAVRVASSARRPTPVQMGRCAARGGRAFGLAKCQASSGCRRRQDILAMSRWLLHSTPCPVLSRLSCFRATVDDARDSVSTVRPTTRTRCVSALDKGFIQAATWAPWLTTAIEDAFTGQLCGICFCHWPWPVCMPICP